MERSLTQPSEAVSDHRTLHTQTLGVHGEQTPEEPHPTAKQRQYESKQQPHLSILQPLMMKPGLSDSKSGSISEQRGIDTHSIRVRFNINEVEEDRRTERGIQARRERKENKKMAEQNREGRIRATLAIIRSHARSANLLRLCRSDNRVDVLLNLFLDLFVGPNRSMRQRMVAFRALPQNQFTNLTPQMENSLTALQGEPSFSMMFSAYLPSAVVTSEDSDEDQSPRARRLRRRWRRRQRQEGRQDAENRRRAAPVF